MNGIIFMGLQASGKSTFFKHRFSDSHVRINLDMLNTRTKERALFNACVSAKIPCVIDNTNPRRADRSRYLETFVKHKFSVYGFYFSSSISECLKRNSSRTQRNRIPDIAIRSTRNSFELPNSSEGFDKLFYVSLEDDEFIVEEWKDEI